MEIFLVFFKTIHENPVYEARAIFSKIAPFVLDNLKRNCADCFILCFEFIFV